MLIHIWIAFWVTLRRCRELDLTIDQQWMRMMNGQTENKVLFISLTFGFSSYLNIYP